VADLTTCVPCATLLFPSGALHSIWPSLHILVPLGNRAQELFFGTCREVLLLIRCPDHGTTQFKPELMIGSTAVAMLQWIAVLGVSHGNCRGYHPVGPIICTGTGCPHDTMQQLSRVVTPTKVCSK
jgi:hypothetical protein